MAVRSSLKRLSQTFVEKHATPGLYSDGNGLYLQITAAKDGDYVTKSWIFRYAVGSGREKREHKMGLGGYPLVPLAMAREIAIECSLKRLRGIDPLEERETQKREKAVATAKTITFEKAAEQYIAAHRAGWRNVRHATQWPSSLRAYVYPILGEMAVRDIDTGLVMRVLQPIWTMKPVTAGRLRGRIERILGWAKVNGYREGENPARWTDNFDHLLPQHAKIRKVDHHPALPYAQVPSFMTELRTRTGTSAKLLEFTILTTARTKESIGTKWSEIDFGAKVWTVPPERMKGGREHKVPLCDAAMAIIEQMRSLRQGDYVFPGDREGKTLGHTAMLDVIERLNIHREKVGLPRWGDPKEGNEHVVPHGFRSSFRDWVSEETDFPGDLAEAALAHIKGDKAEAAYKRGTMFQKRRKLMDAWAAYCADETDNAKILRHNSGGAHEQGDSRGTRRARSGQRTRARGQETPRDRREVFPASAPPWRRLQGWRDRKNRYPQEPHLFPECGVDNFRRVAIKRLPENAWDADPNAA
jgi:integrase